MAEKPQIKKRDFFEKYVYKYFLVCLFAVLFISLLCYTFLTFIYISHKW